LERLILWRVDLFLEFIEFIVLIECNSRQQFWF